MGFQKAHHFVYVLFLFQISFYSFPLFPQEKNKDPSLQNQSKPIEVVGETNSKEISENFRKNPTGFQSAVDLSQYKSRYTNLPDVLEREAGVRIRRYGGLGSYSTLSLRGTNPNQSRIYIDGIPFNNTQGGEVNLADLPFENLQSIEIYRSGAPVGFTGSVIGGSVNLVSQVPKGPSSTRVNLGGGSYRSAKTSVSHLGTYQGVGTSLFFLGEKSDQNFPYLNPHGTLIVNPLDDTIDRRKNAQFERSSGMIGLSKELGNTRIKFWNDLNYRMHGIPGPASNQTRQVHRKYLRNTSSVTTDTKGLLGGMFQLETRAFGSHTADDLFDPKSEFSSGTPNSEANMRQYGAHVMPTIYLLEYLQIFRFHAGIEKETFERSRSTVTNIDLKYESDKIRTYTTFRMEDEIRLWKGRLIFTPGIAWDQYTDRFESEEPWYRRDTPFGTGAKKSRFSNPKLGALLKVIDRELYGVSLKGNLTKQNRIPSFLELFGEVGTILANDSLRPEQSRNADIGTDIRYSGHRVKSELSVSYFSKNIKDMILFVPNSQFSLRPENVDSARINGVEVMSKTTLKNWKFIFDYTYQRAINTSDALYLNGKVLPLRPLHELAGNLSYRANRWEFGVEGVYVGAVFKDRTNEYVNYQPARQIWNLFLTITLIQPDNKNQEVDIGSSTEQKRSIEELVMSLDVRNIGDKRVEDIVGYPLPGRNWYLTLSGRF